MSATVTLRPMTQAEFVPFAEQSSVEYARSMLDAGDYDDLASAERASRAELAELLPDGPATEGQEIWVAEDEGRTVGTIWIALQRGRRARTGWVYDIAVLPEQRGKGYGRAIMVAVEEQARQLGLDALGLNVFGANHVARGLYASIGYDTTSVHMFKRLTTLD